MRLLTKSRFKQALECPNKLYYTKKKEYGNLKQEDPFLEALAQGGFQVEELARLEYPAGHLIEGNNWNYDLLVEQTNELLKQENVVIFEAAFKFKELFIRTDILVKKGNDIELIEVKAKSYDPFNENTFIGKQGKLVSSWKPYLFDVAFQDHVIQNSYPTWNIKSFLMMANKKKEAKIDGLNQLFRISKKSDNRTGINKQVNSIEEIGGSVLGKVNIDTVIGAIKSGRFTHIEGISFQETIQSFSDHYSEDKKYNWPVSFSACKACEFKTEDPSLKSGYKECWTEQKGWTEADFEKPNGFEVWNFRSGTKLFENEGKIFLKDYEEEDFNVVPEAGRISSSERRWIQVEKAIENDKSTYVLAEELKEEINKWNFPFNFIDFETSTVALPFNKGRKPYEQVAFQFSHHILTEDGKITHANEFIAFEAGKFPNFDFIRALKKALEINRGTIFKYATHENSIVNAIYDQLLDSEEPDKDELIDFIKDISHSKSDRVETWKGDRDMVDLCEVIKSYYYDPYMKGSNSIKVVLPSILNSSFFVQNKYKQPLKNINVDSLNFSGDQIWLKFENDKVKSPYKLLPPLFSEWTSEELESTISELSDIDNGGAALTAYGKLQYTNMSEKERLAIKYSLLKYCELDTLAMVMIYERFKELIG
jgi:hypothetical protein